MGCRRVIYCCLVILVCLLAMEDASAKRRSHGASGGGGTHVYLLRGIFDVSVGLDALAAKLNARGIPASVYSHGDSYAIAEEAAAAYRAGRVRSIILVGHSLGAGGAVMTADKLNSAGVPVSLLISLDPVASVAVPGNVRRALNFYVSRSGRELAAAPGFRGALQNVDVDDVPGIDHMSIQSMESMHRRVLSAITGR
jgi:pimeloyl-ACP methyl ester carboxylesterase